MLAVLYVVGIHDICTYMHDVVMTTLHSRFDRATAGLGVIVDGVQMHRLKVAFTAFVDAITTSALQCTVVGFGEHGRRLSNSALL